MFDQEDGELNVVIGVLFGVIALVIALVIGLGTYKLRATDAPIPVISGIDGDFADVAEVGEALVKIYFDLGASDLPEDAHADVATVVVALEAAPGKNVLLSGFHDQSGSAEVNAQVARDRALSVRDALVSAGIPVERVLLRRPAVTLGGGDAAEARRVEIRVQ
jgi:outer membrane protein OmpA-like peptidoglycan-associated protein